MRVSHASPVSQPTPAVPPPLYHSLFLVGHTSNGQDVADSQTLPNSASTTLHATAASQSSQSGQRGVAHHGVAGGSGAGAAGRVSGSGAQGASVGVGAAALGAQVQVQVQPLGGQAMAQAQGQAGGQGQRQLSGGQGQGQGQAGLGSGVHGQGARPGQGAAGPKQTAGDAPGLGARRASQTGETGAGPLAHAQAVGEGRQAAVVAASAAPLPLLQAALLQPGRFRLSPGLLDRLAKVRPAVPSQVYCLVSGFPWPSALPCCTCDANCLTQHSGLGQFASRSTRSRSMRSRELCVHGFNMGCAMSQVFAKGKLAATHPHCAHLPLRAAYIASPRPPPRPAPSW